MNNLKTSIVVILFAFLITSCTSENESDNPINVVSQNINKKSQTLNSTSSQNPNSAHFDVIIIDQDNWEIGLVINRVRDDVISFGDGHIFPNTNSTMWYKMGSFIFETEAVAMYNPHLDLITITARDIGWDIGHIVYTLRFMEGTNNLVGTFVYAEYPNRTNRITAWLDKGTLGTHTAGAGLAKNSTFEFPQVNAKKQHFEIENK